jgi:hypothetical protein
LTETQGPTTLCVPQDHWADLPSEQRAVLNARQGVCYPAIEGHMVADPKTLTPIEQDGKAIGEIVVRGNTVMLGYLKDPKATAEAFRGGRMHTGDLAIEHPDGYVEIKDRAKDVIIWPLRPLHLYNPMEGSRISRPVEPKEIFQFREPFTRGGSFGGGVLNGVSNPMLEKREGSRGAMSGEWVPEAAIPGRCS